MNQDISRKIKHTQTKLAFSRGLQWRFSCVAVYDGTRQSLIHTLTVLCLAYWEVTASTGNKFICSPFWIKMKMIPIIWGGGLQNEKLKRLSRSWELASLSPGAAQSCWGGVDYGAEACHHNQHGICQGTKGPGVSFPETCPLILIFDCHGQGCKEHI